MTTNNKICPICGEGQLHDRVVMEETEYGGHKGQTPLYFSQCDACGSEQADAEQTRMNKRVMIAFRKKVDGLLTGAEVRALRERLGISQAQASQIFGGGPVAFSKYESDDVAQSEAMDKLLRVAAEMPLAFQKLKRDAGVSTDTDIWTKAEIEIPPRQRPALRVISSSEAATREFEWKKSA